MMSRLYSKKISRTKNKSVFRGDRLRAFRQNLEYSQEDIAALCSVTRTQIVNLEYCRTEPSVATLVKICKVLDVSADYLLGLTDMTGEVTE